MMKKRPKLQIDASPQIRQRAKVAAYARGISLKEFVLLALAKAGDKELAKLIEKELKESPSPGRPTASK